MLDLVGPNGSAAGADGLCQGGKPLEVISQLAHSVRFTLDISPNVSSLGVSQVNRAQPVSDLLERLTDLAPDANPILTKAIAQALGCKKISVTEIRPQRGNGN